MNMSTIISDIKTLEGLNAISLPFDRPVEVVLQDILETTIRTFSQFKRHKRYADIQKSELRTANDYDKRNGIFMLPESLTITNVFTASADAGSTVTYSATNEISTNVFTVGSPFVGFGSYYPQDIVNATAIGASINKYAGITSQVPTSRWMGHNKIQLFNFPENVYVHFVVECEHDPSGETIPESCREAFMELAIYDVETSLYAVLKNMVNVGTVHKDIQLKIDDWSGAKDKRDEYIKYLRDGFHMDEIRELVQFF